MSSAFARPSLLVTSGRRGNVRFVHPRFALLRAPRLRAVRPPAHSAARPFLPSPTGKRGTQGEDGGGEEGGEEALAPAERQDGAPCTPGGRGKEDGGQGRELVQGGLQRGRGRGRELVRGGLQRGGGRRGGGGGRRGGGGGGRQEERIGELAPRARRRRRWRGTCTPAFALLRAPNSPLGATTL
jgi:hypothetical protein